MPRFTYVARDAAGDIQRGEIEGESEASVAARLRRTGLTVTVLQAARSGPRRIGLAGLTNLAFGAKGATLKDLSLFCREFSTLLGAGVPVLQALNVLADPTAGQTSMHKLLQRVAAVIRAGGNLTDAFAREERFVPPVMVHTIEAGEASGTLAEVCARLADHFERDLALTGKISSAFVYPAFVVSMAGCVILLLLMFIVPQFATLFAQMNVPLPGLTVFLLNVGFGLRRFFPFLALAAGALAGGVYTLVRDRRVRQRLDGVVLRIPLVGLVTSKWLLARFSRTLATLLRSGVTLLDSLPIVGRVLDNRVLTEGVERARRGVQEGLMLGTALSATGLYPPMLLQMVAVGEETGALDDMLEKAAHFYEREVDNLVSRLMTMLEPALLVCLGSVVAFVLVSVMTPMFNAFTKIQ